MRLRGPVFIAILISAAGCASLTPSSSKAGIRWIEIPAGSFTMGKGGLDSWPAHRVAVRAFRLAMTLVTNRQYRACVEAGVCAAAHVSDRKCQVWDGTQWTSQLPASFQGDDQPVVCVDWEQARVFSAWVGGRLPTEAEYEYAASAGKGWMFPWGDEGATCERAVFNDGGYGCAKNATWPVCSKTPGNAERGLCDMAGNAWEWMQDSYHDSYDGAPADGSAWEDPASARKVRRGGSWRDRQGDLTSFDRNYSLENARASELGFRPAR